MAEASPDTTTPRRPRRLRRGGGWLLYLAVLTCPIGKLAIIVIAGSTFGLSITNPWIVGGALVSIGTAAVLLTRRALRNRTSTHTTDPAITDQTAFDHLDD